MHTKIITGERDSLDALHQIVESGLRQAAYADQAGKPATRRPKPARQAVSQPWLDDDDYFPGSNAWRDGIGIETYDFD